MLHIDVHGVGGTFRFSPINYTSIRSFKKVGIYHLSNLDFFLLKGHMHYITFFIYFDGSNLKIFQFFVNGQVFVCLICKLSRKKKPY